MFNGPGLKLSRSTVRREIQHFSFLSIAELISNLEESFDPKIPDGENFLARDLGRHLFYRKGMSN